MGCIVGEGQTLSFVDRLAFLFFAESLGVGAVVEARDYVVFAAHPFDVVGGCSFHGCVEERLAEAADIDHNRQLAICGDVAQGGAELPGDVGIHARQHEFAFLQCDALQIFSQTHWAFPRAAMINGGGQLSVASSTGIARGTIPSCW